LRAGAEETTTGTSTTAFQPTRDEVETSTNSRSAGMLTVTASPSIGYVCFQKVFFKLF